MTNTEHESHVHNNALNFTAHAWNTSAVVAKAYLLMMGWWEMAQISHGECITRAHSLLDPVFLAACWLGAWEFAAMGRHLRHGQALRRASAARHVLIGLWWGGLLAGYACRFGHVVCGAVSRLGLCSMAFIAPLLAPETHLALLAIVTLLDAKEHAQALIASAQMEARTTWRT